MMMADRILVDHLSITENLHHAGHHRDRRGKQKHFCGAGGHHHQREEPAPSVGEGELQRHHPRKHR